MKKNVMKKKLLIPCITAACIMYGCSSPSSAPAISTETQAPTGDEAETNQEEASKDGPASADGAEGKSTNEGENTSGNGTLNTSENDDSATDSAGDNSSADTENNDKNSEDDNDENQDNKDSDENNKEEKDSGESEEENSSETAYINTVKDAQPETFPGCTYGSAFEEFFTSPQWEYFESTDGQHVVEFTGECMYAGARTKARMQFVVGKDEKTVTTGALYYNSTPQTRKIITDSLNKIFEQYAKAHGIPYTLPAASEAETAPADAQATSLPDNTAALPPADTSANTIINSGGAQDALNFAAWTNPDIGSWYSPTTGYYVIPFVDNAGNASISFAKENTRASYAAVYYTDAVSAVTNDAGGLTYQGYIYTASSQPPALIGMVEVSWNSVAELKSLSVKMINGNQTMDTSMTASDYAYFGAVNE